MSAERLAPRDQSRQGQGEGQKAEQRAPGAERREARTGRDREKGKGVKHEDGTKISTRKQMLALLICLGVCFAAAGVGSLFTSTSVTTWYPTLIKPEWTPPKWVFGPVWSTLYAMMAVAAWLVWRRGGSEPRKALQMFALQLGLNVLWSVLFFGLRLPGVAFVEIIILWFAIGVTARVFGRITVSAGLLFIPYFAWVGFAAILNFAIWRLNA